MKMRLLDKNIIFIIIRSKNENNYNYNLLNKSFYLNF